MSDPTMLAAIVIAVLAVCAVLLLAGGFWIVPLLRNDMDEIQEAFRRMDAIAEERARQASTW